MKEYYLFDPLAEYLDPPLQGYRLRQGVYRPIRSIHGRLPSQVLGLHLERDGQMLRLWNPISQTWLPTTEEARQQEAEARAEAEQRAEQAETESERLRRENEELRRRLGEKG